MSMKDTVRNPLSGLGLKHRKTAPKIRIANEFAFRRALRSLGQQNDEQSHNAAASADGAEPRGNGSWIHFGSR